jgi:hypothetical protein
LFETTAYEYEYEEDEEDEDEDEEEDEEEEEYWLCTSRSISSAAPVRWTTSPFLAAPARNSSPQNPASS